MGKIINYLKLNIIIISMAGGQVWIPLVMGAHIGQGSGHPKAKVKSYYY